MKQKVLIIEGRAKARALAKSLLSRNYDVTVINRHMPECSHMAKIPGLKVIYGDGTRPYILDEAEAAAMNFAIALSSQDARNLVSLELCKKQYGINRTIALISDPKLEDFFHQMGVDGVVCASTVINGLLEQEAFVETISRIMPVGQSGIALGQVHLQAGMAAVGKSLSQLQLPLQVLVVCLIRGSQAFVPDGSTVLQAGDLLILVSDEKKEAAAIQELMGK